MKDSRKKNIGTKYSGREEEEMKTGAEKLRVVRQGQKGSVFEKPVNRPRLPSQGLGWYGKISRLPARG